MSSSLRRVEGKLTALRFLERPDQDRVNGRPLPRPAPAARKKSLGDWFTQRAVPILAALTGNDAAANAVLFQHSHEDSLLAQLNAEADSVAHPSTWSYANIRDSRTFVSQNAFVTVGKNGKILLAKLPTEIEIAGEKYRGFLGGQCFEVGDDVVAVIDRQGRLYAMSSPDRRYLVMDYACGDTGLAGLTHTLWTVWKWSFIVMNCVWIPVALVFLWTDDDPSSRLDTALSYLAGGPLVIGVLLALLLGVRLSWSEWLPAWRTSRILQALGRADLCRRDFGFGGFDADRAGRVRDRDIGRVYYA